MDSNLNPPPPPAAQNPAQPAGVPPAPQNPAPIATPSVVTSSESGGKSGLMMIVVVLLVLVLLGVLGAGAYFYFKPQIPFLTPAATPAPQVNTQKTDTSALKKELDAIPAEEDLDLEFQDVDQALQTL